MRRRRSTTRQTTAVLLLALAASASASATATSAAPLGEAPASMELRDEPPPRGQLRASSPGTNTSRWLTYACGSKSGNRNLLERILTHPCTSSPHQYSANDLYEQNSNKESSGFWLVVGGILAGVLALLGILFLLDRETFNELTGVRVKEVPLYCNRRCRKPRIDAEDDDEPTPYERDAHLTKDTREYLEEKHDEEVERPRRILKKYLGCCFGTKDYEGDKYKIPWTGSEDQGQSGGCRQGMAENVNIVRVFWDEFRLRFFWKPTKEYSGDKYAMREEGDVDIQMAMSSYEEAEPGTTPW